MAWVLAGGCTGGDEPEPWTLVGIGDTQVLVQSEEGGRVLRGMTQWVAKNHDDENIVFVTQLGDIVQRGAQNNSKEWNRANAAMSILHMTPVGWGTSVGNHDLDRVNDYTSGYSKWKSVFGAATTDRFADQAAFKDVSSNELNTYYRYRPGGREYLHLQLELDIPDRAIAWAQSVIRANEGLPTIISTHVFEGTREGPPDEAALAGPGRNSANRIWDKLIRDNDQIFMVLSGHTNQRKHHIRTNNAGHSVFTIVQDFTGYDMGDRNRGWMRLYEFDEANSAIRVRTYSPSLDRYMTDPMNQFELPLNWSRRFPKYSPES